METDNLFDFEEEIQGFVQKEALPISLFQEIEVELLDKLLHTEEESDQTDGVLDLTRYIVEKVKQEFEKFVEEDGDKAAFLNTITKIFTVLLTVKADTPEKVFKYCKNRYYNDIKKMVTKFKIKTLLPEQKTIQIKNNSQPVRTITVRRKIIKFTDRWAKQF